MESQGVEILSSFDAPGRLTGFAAMYQNQPLSLYLTADGAQVIMSPMFDNKGVNLSEAPLERLVSKPMSDSNWKKLDSSTWIDDGSKKTARVV